MTPIPRSVLFGAGVSASVAAVGVASYVALVRPGAPLAPASSPPVASSPSASPAPSARQPAPATTAARPQFDVARIEPSGETVVAGRAAPGAKVALLDGGRVVAEGAADANGQFVVLPRALAAGDHLLTLRASEAGGTVDSDQSVAAAVPQAPGGPVVAALAAPGQPTRVLSGAPKTAPADVAIHTAEAGEDGAFMAAGTAKPDSTIRLYLNGSFVAPVQAGPDGAWGVTIKRGMAPGHYDIRADAVAPANGAVIARAEAPFDYPAERARAAAGAASGPRGVQSGDTVVAAIRSVTVSRGDSLWRISRRILGHGIRYSQIYEANASQIRDPNRIWPGQVLVAPKTSVD